MRSGFDPRPLARALPVVLAAALGVAAGCSPYEVYKPVDNPDKVPATIEARAELPPPPPLPPPAPPENLSELLSRDDASVEQIRPGDVLSVLVRDEPELSQPKCRVRRDGVLRLPWIGELNVVGRTRLELEEDLTKRLEHTFLKRAEVEVELLAEECRRVYVLGRVNRPGILSLPVDRRVTLVQIVTLAGGLATAKLDLEADASSIHLIRVVAGKRRTFRVSIEQILDRDQLDRDIFVDPDDIIYVPPKRELFVFGAVGRPGGYPLADGSRLSIDEVLSLAGGFSGSAERDRITVIRHGADGGAASYHVNMNDAIQRATTQVTSNDTIIVQDRPIRRVYVLGNVERPGAFEVDEKGLSVIKVLAMAGGLKRIADGDAVRLLRTTPQGRKIYRVAVNSIIREGRTEDDPILIPGDIVFVPESFF